jgi:hypothetical protein
VLSQQVGSKGEGGGWVWGRRDNYDENRKTARTKDVLTMNLLKFYTVGV